MSNINVANSEAAPFPLSCLTTQSSGERACYGTQAKTQPSHDFSRRVLYYVPGRNDKIFAGKRHIFFQNPPFPLNAFESPEYVCLTGHWVAHRVPGMLRNSVTSLAAAISTRPDLLWTHPDPAYMLSKRHSLVLSGAPCDEKAAGPSHPAATVARHDLRPPLAGRQWLCLGCPQRCLVAQGSRAWLTRSPGLARLTECQALSARSLGGDTAARGSRAPRGLGRQEGVSVTWRQLPNDSTQSAETIQGPIQPQSPSSLTSFPCRLPKSRSPRPRF